MLHSHLEPREESSETKTKHLTRPACIHGHLASACRCVYKPRFGIVSKSCSVLARSTCSHRPARAPRYSSNCGTCRRCQPDHGTLSLHMNGVGSMCVRTHKPSAQKEQVSCRNRRFVKGPSVTWKPACLLFHLLEGFRLSFPPSPRLVHFFPRRPSAKMRGQDPHDPCTHAAHQSWSRHLPASNSKVLPKKKLVSQGYALSHMHLCRLRW